MKKWDLPWEHISALAVLGGCFLLGGVVGCCFAALSGDQGAQELEAYLEDYLLCLPQGSISLSPWGILWDRMKYLLTAVIFGFTALGVIGLPAIVGTEGFFLSFSVGCFCRVFGRAGLLPAFVLFGLPAIVWVPALFLMGVQSFHSAKSLWRRGLSPGGKGTVFFGRIQWCRLGLCVGLTLACVLLEYWVVPVLLEICARMVL